MKVLLVPSAFHPSVGGVEEMTRHLGLELRARGHVVEVLTSRREGDDWPQREVVDGLPVVRSTFPAPRAHLAVALAWPYRATRELLRLRHYVESSRPDVLHVHCFSTNGVYATVLSRLCGVPLLVSLHGETVMDDTDVYDHSAYLRVALRAGLKSAAAITGCSRYTLDDAMQRFGPPGPDPQIIFNGVDLSEPDDAHLDIPFDRFVLAMGRVVHKKGFDLLLRAWARTAEQHPDVGLVLAGRGAERDALVSLSQELGVASRVWFPGVLTREQIAAATSRSDVLVMPSRVEPFGIVALEGWRAGTAVLVSSRGGASEFVTDDVDGLVVDPLDEAALAAGLDRLLSDDALRDRLGAAGRERVQDFSWPAITAQYLDVYASVLRG